MLTRLADWRAHSPTKLLPKQHALRTQCEGSACTFYSNHHNSTSACKALAVTQVVAQTEEAQPGGPVFWAKNEAETGFKGVARKLHASSSPWRYNTITACTGPCQSRRHVAKLGCKTRSTVTPSDCNARPAGPIIQGPCQPTPGVDQGALDQDRPSQHQTGAGFCLSRPRPQ